MRSTLKKSLYLGLAALSFASVAGAANNADAAKKTKPAKTYATASYQNIPDQGQSNVAYNVTGSNALFNKPGTVKGAKQTASKATMSDLASSKQNFMVYQTATTNRGSKYIKVVSFDKQYRGWIYAGNNTSAGYGTGVQQINLATSASPQYSSVYLKNPGNVALKTSPEGSQFNASQNSFAQTGLVAGDKFSVDTAQTVSRTGTTWYHLTDQNNTSVNGWVPNDQVQLSSDNGYFNPRTQVKVNYTNNGQVVKSSNVYVDSLNYQYNNVLSVNNNGSKNGLAQAINSDASTSLNNTYYQLTGNGADSTSHQLFTNDAQNTNGVNDQLKYVAPGDTVNVPVSSTNGNNTVASKFNLHVTNGVTSSNLSTSSFAAPSVSNSDLNRQAFGQSNRQLIDMGNVLGLSGTTPTGIFKAPTSTSNIDGLGALYGNTQTADSQINGAYTNDNDAKTNSNSNNTGTIYQGQQFHYVYVLNVQATKDNNSGKTFGQNIDLYYNAVPVTYQSSAISNSSNPFN